MNSMQSVPTSQIKDTSIVHTKYRLGKDTMLSWTKNRISISGSFLPKGIHLTLSTVANNNGNVNLHFTNQNAASKKARIKVFELEYEMFQQFIHKPPITFFDGILEELECKEEVLGYVSYSEMKNKQESEKLSQLLMESFESRLNTKKGNRKEEHRIPAELEEIISEFADNKESRKILKNDLFDEAPYSNDYLIDGGFVIFENEVIPFIRLVDRWYKLNLEYSMQDVLSSFMTNGTARSIIDRFNFGLKKTHALVNKDESDKFESGTIQLKLSHKTVSTFSPIYKLISSISKQYPKAIVDKALLLQPYLSLM